MKCREVEALLERYLDGELTKGQVVAVDTHLDACASCGDAYGALHAYSHEVQAGLRQFPVAMVPPDFDARVLDAVLARSSRSGSLFDWLDGMLVRPWCKMALTGLLGVVSGAALVLGVLLVFVSRPRPPALPAAALMHGGVPGLYAMGSLQADLWLSGVERDMPPAEPGDARQAQGPRHTIHAPQRRKEELSWHDAPSRSSSSLQSGSWC